MADFGVFDSLLRRRAGSSGLQTDGRRASSVAGALEVALPDCRVLPLARNYTGAGVSKALGGDRARYRGSSERGFARGLPVGGVPPQRRAATGRAKARRRGEHRVFVWHGRESEGLRA